MKTNLLKSIVFILFFSLIGLGCTKDDEVIYELQITDENKVLQQEVKGIEFSFSLLNELGEPAKVFNIGENFSFQFLIKNKTAESLLFYDYGFYTTDDFLLVSSGTKNYGKPMKFLNYSITKEERWIISDGVAGLSVPWHDERSEFQMMHGYFEGLKQPYLEKGKYYTKFTYNFTFGYENKTPKIETGKLTFIINFEIK